MRGTARRSAARTRRGSSTASRCGLRSGRGAGRLGLRRGKRLPVRRILSFCRSGLACARPGPPPGRRQDPPSAGRRCGASNLPSARWPGSSRTRSGREVPRRRRAAGARARPASLRTARRGGNHKPTSSLLRHPSDDQRRSRRTSPGTLYFRAGCDRFDSYCRPRFASQELLDHLRPSLAHRRLARLRG